MPAIGRMRRRYAKSLMGRLQEGGSMVSDVERQQMEQGLQQTGQAALTGQQMQLGQAAKAMTGSGPFQQQPFQEGQKVLAEKAADVGVKASGQQRLMEAQVSDQRKGAVLAQATQLHDVNRQNMAAAVQAAQWFVGLPDDQFADLGAASKGFFGPGTS